MPYRVEYAKSARAGCQGPICKSQGTKIEKAALRCGTWVEIPNQKGAFKWRHFGCMTDKVLQNIASTLSNLDDELDGFDELREDDQEKIRSAVANGKLDDADKTEDTRPPKEESPKKERKEKKEKEVKEEDVKEKKEKPKRKAKAKAKAKGRKKVESEDEPSPSPSLSEPEEDEEEEEEAQSTPEPTPKRKRAKRN